MVLDIFVWAYPKISGFVSLCRFQNQAVTINYFSLELFSFMNGALG
jgi:hypothetical protein